MVKTLKSHEFRLAFYDDFICPQQTVVERERHCADTTGTVLLP